MEKEIFIEKEKLLLDLEYQLIKDFISIRKEQNITQQELAEKSQIIRQTVNRVENCLTSPQIRTMLKLLEPLGFTLKIVPIKERND